MTKVQAWGTQRGGVGGAGGGGGAGAVGGMIIEGSSTSSRAHQIRR